MAQKWAKKAQIWFQWGHIIKIIGYYSGTSFGSFWDFLTIFEQFSFFHWKSMIFRKNSKNPYFDLWDLLWWVFHMVLGLNHWFRPKNEGSKKSVPQNCKSAGSDALNMKPSHRSYHFSTLNLHPINLKLLVLVLNRYGSLHGILK